MTESSSQNANVVAERLRVWNSKAVAEVIQFRDETTIVIPREFLRAAAEFCRQDAKLQYNLLSAATCVDRFPHEPRFELNYQLVSIPRREKVRLKVRVLGNDPVVDSLVQVWPGANWLEREIFDLFGIRFNGHPDLRRILMWDEFVDHPMRKDYREPDDYEYEPTPHDDVLEDDYLAALLTAAEANPDAAVVYSDIQSIGTRDGVIRQPTIAGSPFARQLSLLRYHYSAVAFRGLTRISALRSILPMAGNPCENFAADTVWMARQALAGNLVRVPRALYRKRYHANNTHAQWSAWPYERRVTAWIRHCLDMLAEALKASNTPSERRMLHGAARMRLLQRATSTSPYHEDLVGMNLLARARLRSRFDAAAARRPDVGPPETAGRFGTGSRAVSALTRMLAGRTLQGLVE